MTVSVRLTASIGGDHRFDSSFIRASAAWLTAKKNHGSSSVLQSARTCE